MGMLVNIRLLFANYDYAFSPVAQLLDVSTVSLYDDTRYPNPR